MCFVMKIEIVIIIKKKENCNSKSKLSHVYSTINVTFVFGRIFDTTVNSRKKITE